MKTHVTGQPVLDELRQHALSPLLGHPLFTPAEHQRATQFAFECEDIARLTRWTSSIRAEIARRETDAARQRCHRAAQQVLRHLRAPRFRGHYPALPHLGTRRAPTRTSRPTGRHLRPRGCGPLPASGLVDVCFPI
ncbi:MAG: hypothetical protein ACRYG7_49770 [Janthinobacterium lividum]